MLLGSAWLWKHMWVFTEHLNAVAESSFSLVVSCRALAGGYIHRLILLLADGCALPQGLLCQITFRRRGAIANKKDKAANSDHDQRWWAS
jgi:hypothetical protein